jgi:uncharacterized membrane protein YphA (DoxX/SURF4 family)
MKVNLVLISRIFVGSLFIISGLIKANDPLGFSYKLEEYFAPDVLNWTIFIGTEVWFAALISIGEIVLGVAFLAGEKSKLAAWLLLIMMIFFTFLTGYTAIGNWFFEHYERDFTHNMEEMFGFVAREIHYFKDCGCFGDAIPFTPMDSFVKDLVLLVFTLILFKNRNTIKPNNATLDWYIYGISLAIVSVFAVLVTNWFMPVWFIAVLFGLMLVVKKYGKANPGWLMAFVAFGYTSLLPLYSLTYIPPKDFRPFAVGENIQRNMELQEGEEPPIYTVDYTMKSKSTGEERVVSAIEYMEQGVWQDTDLVIVNTGEQYLFKDGIVPPIHDFVLESPLDGGDYTYSILEEEYVFIWISYDLDAANLNAQITVKQLTEEARKLGFPIYQLTASSFEDMENFKQQHQLDIEMFTCDATTLKTVIRSNPGLIVLNRGTVIGKYPFRKVTTIQEIREELNF